MNSSDPKARQTVRAFSNRILESADSGLPRAQFFKQVSRMLLDFTQSDTVRVILVDRGRRYWCELSKGPNQPFLFEVTPDLDDKKEVTWCGESNRALEQLCHEIIAMAGDAAKPWFTQNGSFWSGAISSVPIPGLDAPSAESGPGLRIDEGCNSLALIPIESGQARIGLVQLVSQQRARFDLSLIEDIERLTQTFGVALTHRRLQVALRERVKELTCLYGIAKLAAHPDMPLEELLRQAVALLPPAWLYPDSACGRIELNGRTYRTHSTIPAQRMKADIVVRGKACGFVEVGYIWEKPELDEGPFLSEERNLIDTIAREISIIVEQKQAEEEKSRLQEQLLHADRLATIGQLGAGVAHELNEPMASILGFAQLAVKDPKLSDQTKHDLEKIVSSTLHAREVISKLLAFARQTTPEKDRTDLNNLVKDGLQFLQSRCTKAGIEVSCLFSKELPQITVDRSQILQVLTNLVVNSIQAMPNGGRLSISTSFQNNQVLLSVEDTGTGMSEEVTPKIFDPFFTTKQADQGTGLGLSVVSSIVASHGGSIDVASKVGQGTRFTVRLPVDNANTGKERSDG
jgi:two-component system NtrC family sensor kinase